MTDQTIASLREFGLIDRVRKNLGSSEYVLLGPGDDAAHVATADGTYLVATDMAVEGRHFRRDWSSAESIGRKVAASNLSDINAMGGVATALTVAFAAPADTPLTWVDEFTTALEAEAATVGAHVVGGDISEADMIVVSVTALGDAEKPVTRAGAKPGDVVAHQGELGVSGAGLAALSRGFRSPKTAVDAHRAPTVDYAAGPIAAAAGATAMIDVSDGLLADLGHIARASNVAIDLAKDSFAIPEPVQTVASALGGADPLGFVLTGGESYNLVATFPNEKAVPHGWTVIGAVAEGEGVTVDGKVYDGDLGHEHFR